MYTSTLVVSLEKTPDQPDTLPRNMSNRSPRDNRDALAGPSIPQNVHHRSNRASAGQKAVSTSDIGAKYQFEGLGGTGIGPRAHSSSVGTRIASIAMQAHIRWLGKHQSDFDGPTPLLDRSHSLLLFVSDASKSLKLELHSQLSHAI